MQISKEFYNNLLKDYQNMLMENGKIAVENDILEKQIKHLQEQNAILLDRIYTVEWELSKEIHKRTGWRNCFR